MLVISVDNREVKIPQSYNELTLDNFQQLWKIMCKYNVTEPDTEEQLDNKLIDEINLTKELCAKLLGLSPKDIDRLDYNQCQQVVDVFNKMLESDKVKSEWGEYEFRHKGETYYFPKVDFKEMTFGEYATLKQYEQVLSKDNDKRFDFIPEQIALVCRKKDEEKESYDLGERAKLFKDITMDVVMRLTFFLHKRIETLQYLTQIYSKETKTVQQEN
jgi:hypothetical protein